MIAESAYHDYLQSLLAGRRADCNDLVRRLLDSGTGVREMYRDLFQRSMYRVGELWEHNRITVATEHLATSITEGLLNLVYPMVFATERVGKTAIVSCAANEFHQVGGKMVADILELNGWDAHFLGANMPAEDMSACIQDTRPDLVALSLSVFSNMNNLIHAIEVVRTDFSGLPILVGGQAFRWGGVDTVKRYAGVEYLGSLDDLEGLVRGGKG
jgi:methanogenic corrinoid protein MtbC1